MKLYKLIIIILVVFLNTKTVLSEKNIFNVNNIELEKTNISNTEAANKAIKKGFEELIERILLSEDKNRLLKLEPAEIKELVSYYQVISENDNAEKDNDKLKYNIFFDKNKFHKLFYKQGIFYSEITDKELYFLPILQKEEKIFIFNQNFFYENWKDIYKKDLIEFLLPLESIEIIEKINFNKENLLMIELNELFKEYTNKNLALLIIDTTNKNNKIYLKTNILGKKINKNILIKNENLDEKKYYEKIIKNTSEEITNIIKSQNLVDVRTPSFLNTKFEISRKNNLVELNDKLKQVELIDSIFVQEFNNQYVFLKIKYLGKLDKIIKQLEDEKIILKLEGDQWSIKIL